jgi:hypothetical protein
MGVRFTQDAENERIKNAQRLRARPQWELLITTSLVEAVRYARDHGWKDKQVQVKRYGQNYTNFEYHVEPFEKDCSCPQLLRYKDYFD